MRIHWMLAAATFAAATAAHAVQFAKRDVGPNTNAKYVKECGACHFPYQAAWLPERSWRKLMATLSQHFGENAALKPAEHQAVLDYLVANSAERARNLRSHEMLEVIKHDETPTQITRVLYLGGIHGGFLDAKFRGKPKVNTLATCSTCHLKADRGWFGAVTYEISDADFAVDDVDPSASLPVPSWMRIGGSVR